MMPKFTLNKKLWTGYAQEWAKLKPPERPSAGELRIYEQGIRKIAKEVKNPKAVVCGATPELRDLLAKYKFTVLDLIKNYKKARKRYSHSQRIYGVYQVISSYANKNNKYFIHVGQMDKELDLYARQGLITKRQADMFKGPWGKFKVTFPPQDVVTGILKKHFNIIWQKTSKIHPVYTYYHIYFGKAK